MKDTVFDLLAVKKFEALHKNMVCLPEKHSGAQWFAIGTETYSISLMLEIVTALSCKGS